MHKIFVREINVPTDAVAEVATVLTDNDITNSIVGSDEDEEMITLEVQYDKDEKDAIKEILDIIKEYDSDANSGEEEDN